MFMWCVGLRNCNWKRRLVKCVFWEIMDVKIKWCWMFVNQYESLKNSMQIDELLDEGMNDMYRSWKIV